MIIYWSMLLWVPLVYLIYWALHREEVMLSDYNITEGRQTKLSWFYSILIFGFFVFWIGMRTYFADTGVYIAIFEGTPDNFTEGLQKINWEGKSPGFELFNLFFKSFISTDAQWWLMTIAVISGFCVMRTLREYSVDFFLSSFIFITLFHFTWMMNGMRQFICVSVLFLCTGLLKDGKFLKYLLVILLLSTIHISALFMLPMYFIARGSTWNIKAVLFVLGIVLIIMFSSSFFKEIVDIIGIEAYSGAVEQFSEDDGVNPLRIAFYFIPPLLAFWRRNELNKYYKKYPVLPICINMSLATVAWYFVGMFTSGILIGRLPIYCDLYNLLLIPFIFKLGFNDTEITSVEDRKMFVKSVYLIKFVYIVVLVLYFYVQMKDSFYISDFTGLIE